MNAEQTMLCLLAAFAGVLLWLAGHRLADGCGAGRMPHPAGVALVLVGVILSAGGLFWIFFKHLFEPALAAWQAAAL